MKRFFTMGEIMDDLLPSQAVMREWLWMERGVIVGTSANALVEARRYMPAFDDHKRIQNLIVVEQANHKLGTKHA